MKTDPFVPPRFDPQHVLVKGLNGVVDHLVSTGRDATYDPDQTVSVVWVDSCRPAGNLAGVRIAFNTQFTVSTTGDDVDDVLEAACQVADQLVYLDEVDGVAIANMMALQEPKLVAPHNPSGAHMCVSTWNATLRKVKEKTNVGE